MQALPRPPEHAQRSPYLGRLEGGNEPIRALEKRRLTGAARPENGDHLTALDAETHIAQRLRVRRSIEDAETVEDERLVAHRERKQAKAPTTNGARPIPTSKARLGVTMPNDLTHGGVQ